MRVIECKNYEDLIDENQLLISSKYVGRQKLSRLGLVVTRKGLSNNGIKSQENLWKSDEKMLLCMNDEDITKMLELKNEKDEPWKVIDKKMRDFMTSLSYATNIHVRHFGILGQWFVNHIRHDY